MENINQLRKQETPLLFNIDIRGANDLFVIDSETQRWYAPTVGGEVVSHTLPCPDMDRAKEEEQQGPASALALPPLASAAPRVCHVEYVPMNALLYICYESGEVVAHDGVPASTGEVLCIVPGGICTASWAPDGTLGVLVSRASPSAAYLFSCETGTLTPLTTTATTTTTAASADVRQAHWRGDSEHFLLAGPGGIDVYDRAGVHGSTCIIPDDVTFCPESVAAWRPSGDLIAAVGRNNNSKCIELLLFERAGYLRHRALLTTVAASVPVAASWNSSSDILAVALWCSEGFDGIAESGMAVELWSVANYQWELKSVLRIPAPQGDNKGMAAFDPEDPLILRAATGHMLVTLRLGRACTVGGAQACAAVIDGTQVRTTYLTKTTMPPPLCASTNTFPCNVLNVGFHCTPEETHAFAVLANNELRVFRVSSTDSAAFENIAGTAPLRLPGLSPLLQPQMLTPTTVIGISAPTSLCVADVAASKCTVIATPSPVLALAAGPYRTGGSNSGRCAYCQLADHKIYKVNVENCTVAQTPCGEIPGPVSLLWPALRPRAQQQRQQQQSDAKKKGGKKGAADDGSEDEMLFFGLTSTSRLYMGSLCVSEVCSSFLVHPSFLVYTTLDNKVRFVALETPVTKDSIAKLEAEWPFAQREIERGSVVVGFVKGSGLVLQVPRGNLELIHPRALVLHSLRRLLDRKLYGLAFREARRHRIDLNVLCDHNLTTFISDAEAFVCQVARVDFINIFLSALRDENICSSTYRPPADILAGSTKGASSAATGKVNRVCAAMRDVFRKVDPDKYLLATLTSFAVATPPDIEGALAEVAKLDKEKLEEALDYLAFLCDINALYDVALGTYDIPLVRTVAKKTQKVLLLLLLFNTLTHFTHPLFNNRLFFVLRIQRRTHANICLSLTTSKACRWSQGVTK